MQKDPLASAVIVTYNQEKYIEQAIDCALAQKVDFGYEIVIGEDCSTDRTREICLRYQDKYPDIIRVITSDKNVGLLDNWYRSVKAARGKYIAGCGGDDYWHNPEKLQKQIGFLEKNPEYGLVHSEIDFYYQNTGQVERNYFLSHGYHHDDMSGNTLELIMDAKYPIRASAAAFPRSIFDTYYDAEEFKRRGFVMEDMPFYMEIAAHSKIHYISESLATYRLLEESVSQSNNEPKKMRFWISDSEMYLYYCDKYNMPRHIQSMHESYWRRRSLRLAFIEKRSDLAEMVRKKYPKLSLKNRVWYWGTKYPILRPMVLLLQRLPQKNK
jgi:glycosyltransferase involved in cell wall biosynthesis